MKLRSFKPYRIHPRHMPKEEKIKNSVLRYIIKLNESVVIFCVIILTEQIRERRDKFIKMEYENVAR